MRFSFFLPLLSRDRRPKARALASGHGLAVSSYGGRLKSRRKRRDKGGMSTIVFVRNPCSAVASFKRVMPSGCRLLSSDPAVLRTTSKAHDLGEIYSKHLNQTRDCGRPSSPSHPPCLSALPTDQY